MTRVWCFCCATLSTGPPAVGGTWHCRCHNERRAMERPFEKDCIEHDARDRASGSRGCGGGAYFDVCGDRGVACDAVLYLRRQMGVAASDPQIVGRQTALAYFRREVSGTEAFDRSVENPLKEDASSDLQPHRCHHTVRSSTTSRQLSERPTLEFCLLRLKSWCSISNRRTTCCLNRARSHHPDKWTDRLQSLWTIIADMHRAFA